MAETSACRQFYTYTFSRNALGITKWDIHCTCVYNCRKLLHFEANVEESASVVLYKAGDLSCTWVWGLESIPNLESYC